MGETDIRIIKTMESIEESFLCCLDEMGFMPMTVKNITERARINRSTFYKHYRDKYDLRDKYVDKIIKEFVDELDVSFIHIKELTVENYYQDLCHCLKAFLKKRRVYLTLWSTNLIERNAFEEMLDGGVAKLVGEFAHSPDIDPQKEPFFTLYARLFLGNMMVSVRWWFVEGQAVSVDCFTRLMILHMSRGIFPTLKNQNTGE